MSGAGVWAWRRNSGYVIMGGVSFDGAAGGRSGGIDGVEGFCGAVGGVDCEVPSRVVP